MLVLVRTRERERFNLSAAFLRDIRAAAKRLRDPSLSFSYPDLLIRVMSSVALSAAAHPRGKEQLPALRKIRMNNSPLCAGEAFNSTCARIFFNIHSLTRFLQFLNFLEQICLQARGEEKKSSRVRVVFFIFVREGGWEKRKLSDKKRRLKQL